MISNPIVYHRNYLHDLPNHNDNEFIDRARSITAAALPLASLVESVRKPLGIGLGSLRTISHGLQLFDAWKSNGIERGTYHLLQTTLSTASVAYAIINPSMGIVLTSLSDILENIRQIISGDGEIKAAAMCALDLLVISSICYVAIEITVACMLLQILIESGHLFENIGEQKWIEAALGILLIGYRIRLANPQIKFMQWKWKHGVEFEGLLCQDSRGFIYVDIPDEHIYALNDLYKDYGMELPPYFGKGRAGGHITVISVEDAKNHNIQISEIGQKITFRVEGFCSVKPEKMKGVERVFFVQGASSELEALRARYGLTPKVHGTHDFHITFGITK